MTVDRSIGGDRAGFVDYLAEPPMTDQTIPRGPGVPAWVTTAAINTRKRAEQATTPPPTTSTRVEHRARLSNGQTYTHPFAALGWLALDGAELLAAVRRVDPGATLEARTVTTTATDWRPVPDPCPAHPEGDPGSTDPGCTCPAF